MRTSADVEKEYLEVSEPELRRIVREKPEPRSAFGAMKELYRRQSPARRDLYAEVLEDPGQSVRIRALVAHDLGQQKRLENQQLLLRHLDDRSPRVLMRVVQSLGRIGDERALESLERLQEVDDDTTRRHLGFAKSLIAYRLRLNRFTIDPPSADEFVEVKNGIRFETSKAESETVKEALQQAKQGLPGLDIQERGAAKLTCLSNNLLLLFAGGFWRREMFITLRDRNALPIVLLKKGLSLDRYSLNHYFFTQPAKNGDDDLLGTRPSGYLSYAGKLDVNDNQLKIRLNSVDTLYAEALDVEAVYDGESETWDFRTAITDAEVAARKSTAATPRRVSPQF